MYQVSSISSGGPPGGGNGFLKNKTKKAMSRQFRNHWKRKHIYLNILPPAAPPGGKAFL